jgi:hypothetical protein
MEQKVRIPDDVTCELRDTSGGSVVVRLHVTDFEVTPLKPPPLFMTDNNDMSRMISYDGQTSVVIKGFVLDKAKSVIFENSSGAETPMFLDLKRKLRL